MAKKEDILSAEQQINDILESLSKMKKAADMLENAQKNTDEVISSSEQLVNQIAILTTNAQKILNNLDNQDVLEEIKGLDKKIGLMKGDQGNKLDEHTDKLIKLKEQSISFRSKVNDGFNAQKKEINKVNDGFNAQKKEINIIMTKHLSDLIDKNDSMTKEIKSLKSSVSLIIILILGFLAFISFG